MWCYRSTRGISTTPAPITVRTPKHLMSFAIGISDQERIRRRRSRESTATTAHNRASDVLRENKRELINPIILAYVFLKRSPCLQKMYNLTAPAAIRFQADKRPSAQLIRRWQERQDEVRYEPRLAGWLPAAFAFPMDNRYCIKTHNVMLVNSLLS